MSTIGKVVGYVMWIGSGILMGLFWFISMTKWLGCFGLILALFLSPGVIIFPLVFWIVEGVFPVGYFIIWGIGIIGLVIAGLSGVGD